MILISRKEVLKTIMDRKELNIIVDDALNDADLESKDIPTIDLYVDQIINLIAERLKDGSERYHDRQLTKTMINNYSKDGVITPVKGKKYTKEQIIQILTVYSMKNTLSIGEIKRILSGAYSIEGFDSDALTSLYDRYMGIKEENRKYLHTVIDGMIDAGGLDVEKDEDFLTLLGGMISLSAFFKNIAQAMIDAKYPERTDDGDKDAAEGERSSDSDKKKEKKEKEKKKKDKEKDKEKEKKSKKKEAEGSAEFEIEITDH